MIFLTNRKNIFDYQNDNEILRCLALQRKKYSEVKQERIKVNLLTFLYAAFSIIATAADQNLLTAIVCFSSVLSVVLTDKWNKKAENLQRYAVNVQQYIDVTLFSQVLSPKNSPWADVKLTPPLSSDLMNIDETDIQSVKDWYQRYDDHPVEEQIYHCQLENIITDTLVKKLYRIILIIIASLFLGLYIFIMYPRYSSVNLIYCFTWFSPIFIYFYNACKNINYSLKKLQEINALRDKIENCIKLGTLANSIKLLKILQDHIMDNRYCEATVPDCFFRLSTFLITILTPIYKKFILPVIKLMRGKISRLP